jgi:lipid-binding SYLF domain-containing protein
MRSLFLIAIAALPLLADSPMDEHNKRIRESATVLNEIMSAGDKGIPKDMLEKAQCVGVVPNLKRVGLIVGGKYGKGVLTCRLGNGPAWSAPSTIRIKAAALAFRSGLARRI